MNIFGAMPGTFSVDMSKQIKFSQGNLQYHMSTAIWRFAGNQYDYIGLTNESALNNKKGWVDAFSWGARLEPTTRSARSTNASDYLPFLDWGVKPIENGGNQANKWRTLTQYEWEYLLRKRPNATNLLAMGCVNGVNGLIILPDNWISLEDVPFTASTIKGLNNGEYYYVDNNEKNHYLDNIYSLEQWQKMEINGAIFLPAAGMEIDVEVGESGIYWSATEYGDGANYLNMQSYFLSTLDGTLFETMCSVRLVQDVNIK